MSILSWMRGRVSVHSRSSRWRSRRQGVAPRLEVLESRLSPAVQLNYGGPGTALLLTENGRGAPATVRIADSSTPTLTINLGTGTFAAWSTASAPGLTYENPGSPATSHSAMLDIGSLNNIPTIEAVLSGDTLDLGILADIRGGVGSISASAATINVSSVNTTRATPGDVSLTASGSLTVGTHGMIDSGNGTITLAADVYADGTGDTNTDALTISSGAVVVSSNNSASAITLRSARMSIATGSSPAVVGSLPPEKGTTKPSGTLNGLNDPHAVAFDANGDLFVANSKGTTVSEFAPGSTKPKATLSETGHPYALAFDGKGDLFVANFGGTTVSEFAPGSTTPTATLTGLNHPHVLAFDGSGHLFVANYGNGTGTTVSEFAPGSTKPTATLTRLDVPDALAFDASGNLFVANRLGYTVSEFAPGSTTPTATLSGLKFPAALAFDGSGNLFVANFNRGHDGERVQAGELPARGRRRGPSHGTAHRGDEPRRQQHAAAQHAVVDQCRTGKDRHHRQRDRHLRRLQPDGEHHLPGRQAGHHPGSVHGRDAVHVRPRRHLPERQHRHGDQWQRRHGQPHSRQGRRERDLVGEQSAHRQQRFHGRGTAA
jgi:sugar lactone lactonase YvrE